jgi:hypothetical protein
LLLLCQPRGHWQCLASKTLCKHGVHIAAAALRCVLCCVFEDAGAVVFVCLLWVLGLLLEFVFPVVSEVTVQVRWHGSGPGRCLSMAVGSSTQSCIVSHLKSKQLTRACCFCIVQKQLLFYDARAAALLWELVQYASMIRVRAVWFCTFFTVGWQLAHSMVTSTCRWAALITGYTADMMLWSLVLAWLGGGRRVAGRAWFHPTQQPHTVATSACTVARRLGGLA